MDSSNLAAPRIRKDLKGAERVSLKLLQQEEKNVQSVFPVFSRM